jgi:endonuclease YncB( thermonuclease family)
MLSAGPNWLEGLVVGVSDGDTMSILVESKEIRIRLYGVDCPELGQAFGKRAKKRVSELCYRQTVRVETKGHDRFKRMLGVVTLPDGRNLNRLVVEEGLAWWYQKYAPRDTRLAHLEIKARKARRGLWSGEDPTAPWDFRKGKQKDVWLNDGRAFRVPMVRP